MQSRKDAQKLRSFKSALLLLLEVMIFYEQTRGHIQVKYFYVPITLRIYTP